MPTLVTVPPATGAKSHARGPEPLLMVLVGGVVVCAEAVEVPRYSTETIDARSKTAADGKIKARTSRMGEPPRDVVAKRQRHIECPDAGLVMVCAELVAAHAGQLACARPLLNVEM